MAKGIKVGDIVRYKSSHIKSMGAGSYPEIASTKGKVFLIKNVGGKTIVCFENQNYEVCKSFPQYLTIVKHKEQSL